VELFSSRVVLIRRSIPANPADGGVWLRDRAETVSLALGLVPFARAVMYRITNVYAIKMAGVFMISLGTIWLHTQVMPRWLAFLTYALALALLVSITSNLWVTLIFPGWGCVVSLHILALNRRHPTARPRGVLP
jgi:hypothetical protein